MNFGSLLIQDNHEFPLFYGCPVFTEFNNSGQPWITGFLFTQTTKLAGDRRDFVVYYCLLYF